MAESTEQDARMWSMFCHLAALAGFFCPFGNLIGPLIVWQVKKGQYPSVDVHGKEAFNFQLSVTIYLVVAFVSLFLLIGFVLIPAVALGALILTIIAGIKANNGEAYRYPLTIRFIK